MIKLPKEVNKVLKTLEGAGAEVYVAGECVRDSLLGGNPYGWDVVTSAGPDKLRELFPEGRVISEKYGILRLEYIEELYDKGGEVEGKEERVAAEGGQGEEACETVHRGLSF